MSLLGNILWLIFGGFVAGIGYIIGGLAMIITVIGIPFGLQSIRYGIAAMAPFGKEVVQDERSGPLATVFSIIWLIVAGWEIALAHLIFGVILGITIIGIPFAKQHFKLIPLALLPFNYDLR